MSNPILPFNRIFADFIAELKTTHMTALVCLRTGKEFLYQNFLKENQLFFHCDGFLVSPFEEEMRRTEDGELWFPRKIDLICTKTKW